jgi:hypothetical protein
MCAGFVWIETALFHMKGGKNLFRESFLGGI